MKLVNDSELVNLIRGDSLGGDSERPFEGQAHTWGGERGKKPLPPMRYRDLGDAIVEALGDFPFHMTPVSTESLAQKILRCVEECWEHGK